MKLLFSTFLLFIFSITSYGQKFLQPHEGFATKKIAYITLKDGSKLEGYFKGGQKARNGGYKWIYFKPEDGKRSKIKATDIQSALLPHSSLSKISKASNLLSDATRWGDEVKLNEEAIKEGYSYLETIVVAKKRKEITALREILNPGYSDNIKVLGNDMAFSNPTASIGGIKLAGGEARSYFIKVGDKKAIKVNANKYEKQFSELYESCPAFMEKYNDEIKWRDIEEHVFAYSQMCD